MSIWFKNRYEANKNDWNILNAQNLSFIRVLSLVSFNCCLKAYIFKSCTLSSPQ